ncbi:hypothetical protein R1sor_009464 [Riccia sorocarpa]|uniref:Uncharacterized protein n=1 Tax=Riccia sorocarpa TaxID=122646 RepID=A0ABD3HV71_9MARC
MAAEEGQSRFLGALHISKCWGPSGGHFTYAGCGGLLKDGRPCGLGLKARRQREITSSSPSSMSQPGTPGDVGKLHKFVSIRQTSQPWGITVIGNPSFTGSQPVLSFSSPGYSYSTTGPVSAKSPSPRVGVEEVIPGARSTAASDSPLVTGGPSSSSLQALKRLQSRVFDMGKDIAHVIASLKLEVDKEEFAESVIDLAG